MPFRPADRLPLLLAEIITVLDRHTIQLQRLNSMLSQLVLSQEKHVDYWHKVRQQYSTNKFIKLNCAEANTSPAWDRTEINNRLQAQNKIKDELLSILCQLQS